MPTAQELVKKFQAIETLPHVAIRLTRLIANENSSIQEFEEIIKLDPTLVLRLMRAINSPFYGLRQKVDSISQALIFLGMKNLRNMVVTNTMQDVFKTKSNESFSKDKLWLHCAAVSICARMIAERIFRKSGEDAYLCGILHDIGIIVEDQVVPELLSQALESYHPDIPSITEHERNNLGTDHCEVGSLLAAEWNLPNKVQKGIREHHILDKEFEPSSLPGIIQLADVLVSKMNYLALPSIPPVLSPSLFQYLKGHIVDYKALLSDLPEELSKAKEIYESGRE